jgi:uncharacterized protein (TIGR03382 family)
MKFALATVAATVSLTLAPAAPAAVIQVTNGSFQSPDTGTGSNNNVDDFVEFGSGDRQSIAFNEIITNPSGGNAVLNGDGDQFLILDDRGGSGDAANGIGVYQNLGSIDADFTYVLSLKVAQKSDLNLPGAYSYGLSVDTDDDSDIFSDPVVVSEDESDVGAALLGARGTFVDRVLSFDTLNGNNASLVGEDLFVFARITSNPTDANQILFDALVVTSTPIPEPASAAVAGLLGLVALRRRRHAGSR